MKIIITGVAGFIGSNLARKFLNDYKNDECHIIGIDDLSYGLKEQIPEGVDFCKLDICSKDIYSLFRGVDYVFHLAAKNCLADCQKDPVGTAQINISGTVNVFQAAKEAAVKKVIFAETSALYEGCVKMPTGEQDVSPESFYAVSKSVLGLFAKAYKKFYGLNFTGLRYFNVYGPHQDYRRTMPPVMSAFIIKLLKGQSPVIYGDGRKKRDFVYIDDVNVFHKMCVENSQTDNRFFNIGTGKSFSIHEIYQLISGLLAVSRQPIFENEIPGEAQETLADISQAGKLGWRPRTDMKTGLKEMIYYIQKEIIKGNIDVS